jgi:hypothetical protein
MITMDICGRWRRSSPGRDIMWNMYKMYHICSFIIAATRSANRNVYNITTS